MKKERRLEISYGRLMRYIVFAYLPHGAPVPVLAYARARARAQGYLHPHLRDSNQHMYYVAEKNFPGSCGQVRYDIVPHEISRYPRSRRFEFRVFRGRAAPRRPIDHANQMRGRTDRN